jgi:hypothetical protein
MKLRIMMVGGCNLPGKVALVLCDEHGVMLPCQAGAVLEQNEGEMSTITVTFQVDGRDVILDGSRAAGED